MWEYIWHSFTFWNIVCSGEHKMPLIHFKAGISSTTDFGPPGVTAATAAVITYQEFPHMVLLPYKLLPKTFSWSVTSDESCAPAIRPPITLPHINRQKTLHGAHNAHCCYSQSVFRIPSKCKIFLLQTEERKIFPAYSNNVAQ